MIVDYGIIDIGSFKAHIRCKNGIFQFIPQYNPNPRDFAGIEMNAYIKDIGPVWTPVPDEEIEKLKKVLKIKD